MKYALLLVAAVVCIPNLAASQDAPDPAKMQKMMQKWMKAATPGEHHKTLGQHIGKWDTVMTITGMGPMPMVSKGTAEIRWLMPGRWIVTESRGTVMGQPSHSFIIHGYDNFKKKHVAAMVDNMNTTLLTFSGNAKPNAKVINMYGLMDEPMTDQVGKWVKYVTRIESNDKFVVEVHDLEIGGDKTKVVDIVFTRQQRK